MSGGTFAVSRGIWSHPAFKREEFTEREAFMWLVSEASWKPRVTRVGDFVVPLERGQLAVSQRFCAKAWGWTVSKVRRFFTRMQKLDMISPKTDAGVTVITVCNYDTYQPGDARADAGPTQGRRRADANEKTDGIQREEVEKEDTSVSSQKPVDEKPKKVPKPKKARTRLPDDWQLPKPWGEWALGKGLDERTIRAEAEQFANHHRSKGLLMADWQAAWRTWVNNHIKFAADRQQSGPGFSRQSSQQRKPHWQTMLERDANFRKAQEAAA